MRSRNAVNGIEFIHLNPSKMNKAASQLAVSYIKNENFRTENFRNFFCPKTFPSEILEFLPTNSKFPKSDRKFFRRSLPSEIFSVKNFSGMIYYSFKIKKTLQWSKSMSIDGLNNSPILLFVSQRNFRHYRPTISPDKANTTNHRCVWLAVISRFVGLLWFYTNQSFL